jgi:hypothetical protein
VNAGVLPSGRKTLGLTGYDLGRVRQLVDEPSPLPGWFVAQLLETTGDDNGE